MIPSDFPKWRTVHEYFRQWSEPPEGNLSLLQQALKKQIGAVRIGTGRNAKTTFCIVDTQRVKHTDTVQH